MRRRTAAVTTALGLACLALLAWWALDPSSPEDATDATDAHSERSPARQVAPGGGAEPGSRGDAEAPDPNATPGAETDGVSGDDPESQEARDAAQARLEDDPRYEVVCELDPPVLSGKAYLAVGGHSDMNGRMVEVVNGQAYLPLVYGLEDGTVFDERQGLFSLEGYGPVAIEWSDPPESGKGACTATIQPESTRASLTGSITLGGSGAPAAGAWLEGCGNLSFADQHGVVHMDIVSEPCVVIAMRQDGLLRTVSEPVPVTPIPGKDVVVDIVIPEAPRAGLGVQISQDDAGILIEGLIEGGPAGAAGLEAGDRIVMVDGEPAAELGLQDFVRAVTGEDGTAVDLVVDRAGERLEFTVVREVLTPG